jgi:sulfonate transport system substrate-binding protein
LPRAARTAYQRAQLHPVAIDDSLIAEQQRTADFYYRAEVIKTRLDIAPSFERQFPLATQ